MSTLYPPHKNRFSKSLPKKKHKDTIPNQRTEIQNRPVTYFHTETQQSPHQSIESDAMHTPIIGTAISTTPLEETPHLKSERTESPYSSILNLTDTTPLLKSTSSIYPKSAHLKTCKSGKKGISTSKNLEFFDEQNPSETTPLLTTSNSQSINNDDIKNTLIEMGINRKLIADIPSKYLFLPDSGYHLMLSRYSSGKIKSIRSVKNHRFFSSIVRHLHINQNGRLICFYENGNIKSDGQWKYGLQHGTVTTYTEDGYLETEATYEKHKLHGSVTQHFKNGKVKIRSTYRHGKKHGIAAYYHESGEKDAELFWVNDKLNKLINYDKNGRKTSESHWKNNMQDGYAAHYFENGDIRCEGYFRKGKQDGYTVHYFENGNIRCEGYFRKGTASGPLTNYDENGKKK